MPYLLRMAPKLEDNDLDVTSTLKYHIKHFKDIVNSTNNIYVLNSIERDFLPFLIPKKITLH